MRDFLLNLSRRHKRALQVVADVLLIWLCLWLAFVVRVGFDKAWVAVHEHVWLFFAAPLITVPVCIRLGMYRAVMRYLGREALVEIAKALTVSALVLALLVYWMQTPDKPQIPRSFVMLYWTISLIAVGGLRLAMRQYFLGDWYENSNRFFRPRRNLPRVVVYGAGSAGNQLVRALRMGKVMEPVAFLDDDDSIATRTIAGLKVYKPKHIEEMLRITGATQVLLAMPSASRARRREVLAMLEPYPVHVRSIPGFMDLAQGLVKVQDLQEVDIADLLGRDAVVPNQALFERCIKEQVVLVTGAGGSIGSELCRQILASGATTLILYEHSEFNLYAISQELEQRVSHEGLQVQLIPVLGSVRNKKRLLEVFRSWPVNTVYHAAAYKHVPIVEHNTAEGIRNNVMGTLYTAQAAIETGVQHFVLISTDKAVRPTNVMGSTKRLAEMVLQALSREPQVQLFSDTDERVVANNTRFTMVRFGNVLGSSGSVIPLFRKQIRDGGPVTVTHPEMTRYFMTIPEASQLVIQAGSMGQGGDVFVLDMGEPVRILEMAQKMIRLSGLTVRSEEEPAGEISIEFTGLRPGEKLYEELLIGDNVSGTEHPMIMRASEEYLPWHELCAVLRRLLVLAERGECEDIRQVLLETVNGYQPQSDIVDWVYLQAEAR
ncbi:polysaccharide biosynthesis protein [Thiopseudomonas denitrificans]|uniref:FlaA1/EpsC-like NDP-sugar epimerase n=1 Tax=Thiopseudomonas denitrificans TaxID=1501432 RepID=A0A4R6TV08_9GAMM|nr:nucleoside-diphosphate sugar epimerase/dehydratase [Thiopseudomonas denitrificans]TDQ37600.1 FlaA1/EpsC-like NDP-sugar epimerase [Thiopseudomonas denitrificans]